MFDLGFGSWGDPYDDMNDMDKLKEGDMVRIKPRNPVRGGQRGILYQIIQGDYMVRFPDGFTCGYDGDELLYVSSPEQGKEG